MQTEHGHQSADLVVHIYVFDKLNIFSLIQTQQETPD